ncbi:SRPBCC family protein [Mycolicibacterium poriferae]|uniref:SRPBCC family protein n=1 Tax=Mycolicibacterium poriferae TaxID=39694 RepID=UPI0024BAC385|nr:SRPBCC family protein [Mycolicibacterium poriferae]
MAKRHPCKRVGLDFVESAPYRFVSTVDLAITPEQLFEVLADETSWPHWASVITNVTWTSPEPRGVGTTRTVEMRGGITGHEEYLVWQPCTRMAFRFNESTTGAIAAFAEDYRVTETAAGCHLTWIMALEPNGPAGRLGLFTGRPVMGWLFQRFLHNLRAYTDERYSTAQT